MTQQQGATRRNFGQVGPNWVGLGQGYNKRFQVVVNHLKTLVVSRKPYIGAII